MHPVAIMLAVAALGVEYGWQPGEDGQLEYIIQIEPELIKTLSEGKVDLLSEIPPELQGVKKFRIRVGVGEVPRVGLENHKAATINPPENIANQPPALGGARPLNTTRSGPGDPRGSPGSNAPPGTPLTPPASNPLNGGASGGNNTFPPLGRAPGISREAPGTGVGNPANQNPPLTDPLRGDGRSTFPTNTPADNNNAAPGASAPWNSQANNSLNTGGWQAGDPRANQPNPNLTDPRMAPVPDPRFQTTQTPGLPEIRRDANADPRYSQPPYNQPPQNQPFYNQPPYGYGPPPPNYAWNGYNAQPLRDPGPNPNFPPAAVGTPPNYQQVAGRDTNGTSATTNTSSNSTIPPTTPTKNTSARESERYADDAAKPWLPLTFTAMLLFASVGLNFYLGWIAQGIYQRYRALLMEVRNVRAAAI